jgi:integrase
LYLHRRQYRARLPGKPFVYFGTDYPVAMAAYAAWKAGTPTTVTVAWLIDWFTCSICPAKVKAKQLAERTAKDYQRDGAVIKSALGHIPLAALAPHHIAVFRDARAALAPTHVRNEMACLSSALSWAVENKKVATNVAKEIRRPRKQVRERLITHDEYLGVYVRAVPSVKLAMVLCVRTLGLPGDVLRLGPRNLVRHDDGRCTLRFRRGKTNVQVEIDIVGDLADALAPFIHRPSAHPSFVRREDGKPYTVDGIGAMFRRYCVGTKDHPVDPKYPDFGLRDLRAKGATDMYRADPSSIHKIQRLLGHKSVQTTEIYLKGLLTEIVRPNEVPILALVKR